MIKSIVYTLLCLSYTLSFNPTISFQQEFLRYCTAHFHVPVKLGRGICEKIKYLLRTMNYVYYKAIDYRRSNLLDA
ncbi:hypothetical protein C1646_707014 [Rhizophagus diaphanus]|nr:hypothetical protein C1646_707014 [Rhizophagus diaphanus] [Rhizophagus sp. MUCL 43196]